MRKNVLPILVSVLLLAGCGPASDPEPLPLAPGTMRMISVERVEDANSLLPNGSFEEWYAGLDAPTGFRAPAPASESTLVRDVKSGHLGATGYTARQTWTGLGLGASAGDGFATTVTLAPNTRYGLEVIASATAGMGAAIRVIEGDGTAGARTLARSVVEIRGGAPARYTGTFTTLAGEEVTLASYALAGSTFPGTVIWSAWRLEEATESVDPINVADRPERRLFVNQALDQVRAQVRLYGGAEAWTEATAPNRKNAARILREEGVKGESILGYGHHVSSKSELAWFEKSTAPPLPLGPVGGAAREAILRADRALNARGIQLVVVPVPERVQLSFDQVFRPSAELPINFTAHAAFVDRLLSDDVLVLDPAPKLWAMKSEGKVLYWLGDTDTPSATVSAIAEWIAPQLSTLGLSLPKSGREAFSIKVDTIALEQRLVPGLPAEYRASFPQEEHAVQSVRDERGELFQPAPASPVLVAGNLGLLHQVRGASLAAHLSMALGLPVALPGKNLADSEILGYLAGDNVPEMASAKFVVFCVSDKSLSSEGWK